MRASIAKVAQHANVSTMTVSRVIRGRKNQVNPETYERVMAAVRELNYIPTQSSFQNRHSETRAIGVVPFHANLSHTLLDNLTNGGIYEGARKHGYDILVMLRDEADWMVNRQDIRFLDRRSDGFIFISSGVGEWQEALDLLVENQIPTVVCYRRDVPAEVAWIDPDNEGVIAQALDCLRRHGHRRVAYLGAPELVPSLAAVDPNWLISTTGTHRNYDDIQRRRLFAEAMQAESDYWEHSTTLTAVTTKWDIIPEIVDELKREGITGVVCTSDFIALQFLDLLQSAGVRVPEDISVVGVDNLAESAARGLTSIDFGYKTVGRLAVESWIRLRKGELPSDCCQIVPVNLIERTSVSAPSSSI